MNEFERLFLQAHARYPKIALPPGDFHERLRELTSRGEALTFSDDLYLALACAKRSPGGVEAFVREHRTNIEKAVRRAGVRGQDCDDLVGDAIEQLAIGSAERAPKLSQYEGRAPLRSFVCAVATFSAMSLHRVVGKRVRDVSTDSALAALPGEQVPELALLKHRYRDVFERAFSTALSELDAKDRVLLRLVYLDQARIETIAPMFGVHRVSVSRWLGELRARLSERTRTLLSQDLAIGESDARSILGLCVSQVELSLARRLSETAR